ncbi:MAG: hypothetical protein OCD76_23285 [Reichenbachiella sp.]
MNKYLFSKYALLLIGLAILISSCEEGEDPSPKTEEQPNYISIPDENFERMLIDQGVDSDDTLNHRLLKEDALKVTSLILDSNISTEEENKIADLTGIEAFKNLDSLSAANNTFNELDISANTKLEFLYLVFNYLESLDISNNPNLIDLNVHFNELIEIKGLNEALQLKRLNLSWNYLESLSVNIPSLEGLNIENNELKELGLNGSSSLTSLIAKVNTLETLDLSTNVRLQFITLSSNQLTGLNLKNNIDLEKLRLSANQLSSLDISTLSVLNELDIVRNSDLNCVTIAEDQTIATLKKETHQELNTNSCN